MKRFYLLFRKWIEIGFSAPWNCFICWVRSIETLESIRNITLVNRFRSIRCQWLNWLKICLEMMISSGNLIRFSSYAFLFGDGWMISMHLKAKQNKKITEKHTNCFWRLAASPRNGPERNCDNSVSFRITHSVSSRNDSNSAFQCSEFDSKRFLQIKQEKRRKKQQWDKISLWNENEKSEKKKTIFG